MTEQDLLRIPNLGNEGVSEIKTVLALMGWRLGMDIYWPSDRKEKEELIKRLNNIALQNRLTLMEIQVLKMQFGIGGQRYTPTEIAQVFNLKPGKISQIKMWRFKKTSSVWNFDRSNHKCE